MVWIHSQSGSRKYPLLVTRVWARARYQGSCDCLLKGGKWSQAAIADPNKVETELKVSTSRRVHGLDF